MRTLALAVCLCVVTAEANAGANCDHSQSWQCSGGTTAVHVAPAPSIGGGPSGIVVVGGLLLGTALWRRLRKQMCL